MAQKSKTTQGKRVPAYSPDSIAVRFILGLLLIALGVLLFLSVVLPAPANESRDSIFTLLRMFAGGVAGTLSFALPIIPVWGGILVLLSSQRRPRVREFLLTAVLLVLVCTAITLFTRFAMDDGGHLSLMTKFGQTGKAYSDYIGLAYQYGSGLSEYYGFVGGGVLGMLIAWPLWKLR